ncbi:NUC185 domain-containing protein [Sparassis latifolia]
MFAKWSVKSASRSEEKDAATNGVVQLEELKSQAPVLRGLGFTTFANIIHMKSRVACEISTGDELLLTELILNGVFNPLSQEHCASLFDLLCVHIEERPYHKTRGRVYGSSTDAAGLREAYRKNLHRVELPIVEEEYVQAFKVELMYTVVQWCRGMSCSEIRKVRHFANTQTVVLNYSHHKLGGLFEGNVIRVF